MTIKYFGFPPVVVEPGTKTGIAVLTDNPREVGADRICNAVAAHSLFPNEACVVVDFGTAIKVEAITARGEFLGGAIAPGMDVKPQCSSCTVSTRTQRRRARNSWT